MKISSFIIALIVVGVIATTFTASVVDLTGKYSVTYDQDTLDVFNDTQKLYELTESLENKTNNLNVESGIVDIVGAYIGRALDSVKLSMTSFGVFEKMATKAAELIGLPSYFLTAIIAIVLLLIVFLVISVMVKWQV